jgi:hypothetical protein
MTDGSGIFGLIFGHNTEPPACISCAGVGLTGIGDVETPALCSCCGGSGFGNVPDPDSIDDVMPDANFLARFREPLTEPEMDEAANEFGAALLAGLLDIERRLANDEPLSTRRPKAP